MKDLPPHQNRRLDRRIPLGCAAFILDDPIFNGLAISLIFGIFVSTVLTLVVIPVLYFVAMRGRIAQLQTSEE